VLGESRQFGLISYGRQDGKYIGDLVPIMVMHQTKQDEVKELNKSVQRRFREALKQMGKPL
jgi:hypothetical protein